MTRRKCLLAMTVWGYRLAMTSAAFAMTLLSVIASSSLPVIARSEATKQSPLLLHSVIANRRVGKCAGVKQSPRCILHFFLQKLFTYQMQSFYPRGFRLIEKKIIKKIFAYLKKYYFCINKLRKCFILQTYYLCLCWCYLQQRKISKLPKVMRYLLKPAWL